jgi:hypothetical protein
MRETSAPEICADELKFVPFLASRLVTARPGMHNANVIKGRRKCISDC